MAQAVRLETVAAPNPNHGHMRGAQLLRQPPAAPLGAAVTATTSRPFQNARLQLRRAFGRRASAMPCNKAARIHKVSATKRAWREEEGSLEGLGVLEGGWA